MIRIGIIGAENTHSAAIARTINVNKLVPGCRVVAIWGETDELATRTAEAGEIPTIVNKTTDMLGMIDALIVDHRHAKYHLPAAAPFLEAKLPMFIDKPFCYRLADGKAFLARARKLGVPVTSYSSVPTQKQFAAFVKKVGKAGAVRSCGTAGTVDLKSPYGGVFFYGIHQVDMILEAFGTDVTAVAVDTARGSEHATASLFFTDGKVATMHCLKGANTGFQIFAVTDDGPVAAKIASDANPYLTSTRRFCQMFKTGVEPVDHQRILAPVAVLEAMDKAIRTGKTVRVEKI